MAFQPLNGFFPGTHPELSLKLGTWLDHLRESAESELPSGSYKSIVLAGGYGRGEGGVFVGDDGSEDLYNDLEFFLFTDDSSHQSTVDKWVSHHCHEGDEALGIEVEFKVMPAGKFLQSPPNMFFYDLVHGHESIAGEGNFVEDAHLKFGNAEAIPLHEGSRLLFNRGSGLFFSGCELKKEDPELGFIIRNQNKAMLALGDAVLCSIGEYHWSCRQRSQALKGAFPTGLANTELIRQWHSEGVDFKLNPRHPKLSLGKLNERHKELCRVWCETFLWVEGKRIKDSLPKRQRKGIDTLFPTIEDYVNYSGELYPKDEFPALKNILLRVRDFLKYRAYLPYITDYPRGSIQRVLAHQLNNWPDIQPNKYTQEVLGSQSNIQELRESYETWWHRYN